MTLATEIDIEEKADQLMSGALEAAHGDTALAFHVLATKTGELLYFTNVLQADNEVCQKEAARLRKIVGEDDEGFLEKIYNSDITKVAIFAAGVYTGYKIAN